MYKTAIIMTIATTAFADLGGIPTEYYESEIFGESWEARVTASVYTDDDQQDWFGVPETDMETLFPNLKNFKTDSSIKSAYLDLFSPS